MAKHQYQTEVEQLLHLMTHSLYSNKEIFIRELVSNASDALDKFNYLYLTDEKYKNEDWKPSIFITLDKEDNSITIGDNGIGMDEDDLINNLGTIAKSGTKSFVEKLTGDAKKDSNLIGQFGVGFYSVFMVAKRVDVITKKDDKAFKFSSDGSGEFDISPVTKESRGTIVYIKLKDDEKEFTSPWRIKEVVKKYLNHIAYPIMLNFKEEETIGEGDDKKTELISKSEQVNVARALWTINKSELKKEDYIEFYKSISHGDDEPLLYLHNKVEGSNEYTTLFYIPKKAPMDIFRAEWESGVKLYVKRVFITDSNKELLPPYLRFVKGIIDSSDLPLNISRELLQENRILANIKQSSTKKILQAIAKLDGDDMNTFTTEYNRLIKEGIYTDYTNKELLLDIVRYKSSSEAGYVSFADYISRGNSEKKEIYYIIAKNEAIAKSSPLLEAYKNAGIEVLIMDDYEVDEIVTPVIGKYKDWSLKDISTIEAPSAKTKEELEAIDESFKPLVDKLKDVLKDSVKEIKVSTRLVGSPSCVVKDSSDPMASMAHIFRQMGQDVPEAPLILEINPEHDMIKKLNTLEDREMFEDIAWILLDNAKISEGLDIKDKSEFTKRVTRIASKTL